MAVFDGGNRKTTERQIRETLRVVGTLASHASRTLAFSWTGRRKLLGGLAALEEMLELEQLGYGARDPSTMGNVPFEEPSFAAPLPMVLPPLLHLLAARERRYIAQIRAAAQPIGRHATGAGRCAARDPCSFGVDGSICLDEAAEKVLKARQATAAPSATTAKPQYKSGVERVADALGSQKSSGNVQTTRDHGCSHESSGGRTPAPSWVPHWATSVIASLEEVADRWGISKPQAAPTDLLEEFHVPLSAVYEVEDSQSNPSTAPDSGVAQFKTGEGRHSAASGGAGSGARSYEGRIEDLKVGKKVRVLRYPPSWAATPPVKPPPTKSSSLGSSSMTANFDSVPASKLPQFADAALPTPPEPPTRLSTEGLWFFATIKATHATTQTVDFEYQNVALDLAFGEACDATCLNVLLPELCLSVQGLAVDLIDRGAVDTVGAAEEVISAKWREPPGRDERREGDGSIRGSSQNSATSGSGSLLGTLTLNVEQPILFHLVAEASMVSIKGKGALFPLNHLIGRRTKVCIEADVELSKLTYNLIWREDAIYFSISDLKFQLAQGGDLRCRSAEGGVVEWLLQSGGGKVLHWVEKALRDNLKKEQLLSRWHGGLGGGLMDGFFRRIERLERLRAEAQQRYGEGHGQSSESWLLRKDA